jgi:protein-glutamine gamma-glutamyltransferase
MLARAFELSSRMKTLKWPEPPLSVRARRVLALVAALAIAPQVFFIPIWLTLPCLILTLICAWSPPPPLPKVWRFALYAVLFTSQVFIALYFRRLWGREPGVSLLTVMVAAKLLEVKSTRDAMVVWCSSAVLLVAMTTFHQELPALVYMVAVLIALFAMLDVIHDANDTHKLGAHVRQAMKRLVLGVPIALVLFVFFPRLAAPMWGFSEQKIGKTGLSDSLRMGQIGQLVKSDEVAFRVEFEGGPPARNTLYWRGPVLEQYTISNSGVEQWETSILPRGGNFVEWPLKPKASQVATYAVTLSPHNERWLFALDVPGAYPKGGGLELNTTLSLAQQLVARQPIREPVRYEIKSLLSDRYVADANDAARSMNRGPANVNPKAREWARAEFEKVNGDARAMSNALVRHIRDNNFRYTTRPPVLRANAVDGFWFDTQQGFCEHYASAYVFLMRSVGVPARIVTGYLGGEINMRNEVLIVRQSDAHAWAEVLIDNHWTRVDPTGAIAPSRIEQDLFAALPAGERSALSSWQEQPLLTFVRHSWDATQHAYTTWLLGYDRSQQQRALEQFGLGGLKPAQAVGLMLLLGVAAVLITVGLYAWREHSARKKRTDHSERLWMLFLKRARRAGLALPIAVTPRAASEELANTAPQVFALAKPFLEQLERARYAGVSDTRSLRDALRAISFRDLSRAAKR